MAGQEKKYSHKQDENCIRIGKANRKGIWVHACREGNYYTYIYTQAIRQII